VFIGKEKEQVGLHDEGKVRLKVAAHGMLRPLDVRGVNEIGVRRTFQAYWSEVVKNISRGSMPQKRRVRRRKAEGDLLKQKPRRAAVKPKTSQTTGESPY